MKRKIIRSVVAVATMMLMTVSSFASNFAFEDFTDLDKETWYYPAVEKVINQNLMSSTDSKKVTFEPMTSVTRAMVVKVLANREALKEKDYASKPMQFTDCANNAWYSNAIKWAFDKGIVKGVNPTTFQPHRIITREELSKMMAGYEAYRGDKTVADFKDIKKRESYVDQAKVADWSQGAVGWAIENKVLTPVDGRILPKDKAVRGDLAKTLTKLKSERIIPKEEPVEEPTNPPSEPGDIIASENPDELKMAYNYRGEKPPIPPKSFVIPQADMDNLNLISQRLTTMGFKYAKEYLVYDYYYQTKTHVAFLLCYVGY